MARTIINEKSTFWVRSTFTDKDGNAAIPSTVTYRVDDKDSGTQIVGDTTVTPAATVDIKLDSAVNALVDATKTHEKHIFTITADYGGGDQVTDELVFFVQNLLEVA